MDVAVGPAPERPIIQFGDFTVDTSRRTLSRAGVRLKLQRQPFQVLELLILRAPAAVSREEIRRRVWGDDLNVDSEHSINYCIRQIRSVLADDASTPRFIETLPREGYRFIATVVGVPFPNAPVSPVVETPSDPARPVDAEPERNNEASTAPPEAVERRMSRRGNQWRRRPVAVAMAIISGVGLLAAIYWSRSWHLLAPGAGPVRIQSLAVLPFKNLSGNIEQEYFADGITEELITALARTDSVRLISRTSVMRYKDTKKSMPEITRELNVDAVVEGAVARSGNRIRLSVQLVTPFPERHIWADVYEGDIRDVLDLEHEAIRDLGGKIGTKTTARPTPRSGSEKRLDPEAYENYLRARYFLARRNTETMKKALGYFQTVLRRDPEYAPAYSGMALTYDVLGSYQVLPPEKSFPNARSIASRALELDNSLAEAYTARAIAASFWEFDWSAGERDFQRAIALEPSSEVAHHWYAEQLITVGKVDRGLAEMKRARELDPLSLAVNATLGRIYRDARRYAQALEQCRKTLDLDPDFAMGHWCFGQLYIGQHQYGPAIQELELANTLGTTPLILRDLAWTYAALGKKDKANAILVRLLGNGESEYISPYTIGVVQATLGETDKAFQSLERAFMERDSQIAYITVDPEVDGLRSDPRFQALMEQLHIPQ